MHQPGRSRNSQWQREGGSQMAKLRRDRRAGMVMVDVVEPKASVWGMKVGISQDHCGLEPRSVHSPPKGVCLGLALALLR